MSVRATTRARGFSRCCCSRCWGRSRRGWSRPRSAARANFAADASGAEVTGDPAGLASALGKIERAVRTRPLVANGETAPVSALMIANPFSSESAARWFSTHPDTAERIARLQASSRRLTRA